MPVRRPEERWIVLGVLTFARISMGFQFQSVGAVSVPLMARLGIGGTELGILVGLFSLPGMVLALPGGLLGERFGDRRVVLLGLALMTAGSSLIGLSNAFAAVMLGRFLTAVGAVLLNVLVTKMVADWFSGREIVWAMSILINSWPVGIGLALFTLPSVARAWDVGSAFHLAAGVAAVAWVAMAAGYRPRATPGVPSTPAALTRLEAARVSVSAVPWTLYNVGYSVALTFVPLLLVSRGSSLERAGTLMGIYTVLVVASVQAGGAMAQWLPRPHAIVTCGLVALTVALAALPFAPLTAILLLGGFLGGLPAGALVSAPAPLLRAESRARGMGVFYTWYYAGMAALPPVAGWLHDRFGGGSAVHFAALMILAALPVYLVLPLPGAGRAISPPTPREA
jgi:MFS family permease